MKKRLLIAALAATMSVAATADISITGDAYVSFASNKVAGEVLGENNNKDDQRVRVKVVGSAGDTKVVAVIRNGSTTRVDRNPEMDDGLHMDSLYITTKVGSVDIKAGDYWGTIGLGARSMEAGKKNAVAISTKVANNWTVGVFTANGSDGADGSKTDGSKSTNVNVSGKIGPVEVTAVHNPDQFTDVSAQATIGNIFVAAELWKDKTDIENDTTLIHIGGKVSGFKWDIAQIKNDIGEGVGSSKNPHATGKLAPLGSMLIGTNARGATTTAVANVADFTEILGVSVGTEIAGNTVKAIYTKNTLTDTTAVDADITGTELIVSRPLSNGSTLTANIGKVSGDKKSWNETNMGVRLDVRF